MMMLMILNLPKYRLRRAARQEAKSRRLVSSFRQNEVTSSSFIFLLIINVVISIVKFFRQIEVTSSSLTFLLIINLVVSIINFFFVDLKFSSSLIFLLIIDAVISIIIVTTSRLKNFLIGAAKQPLFMMLEGEIHQVPTV